MNNVSLVFIPGGPGLSSISFKPIIDLNEKYRIFLFDPPGTGKRKALLKKCNFDSLKAHLDKFVKEEIPGKYYLLGHSFGGILGILSDSFVNPNCLGMILLATPLDKKSMEIVNKNYLAMANAKTIKLEKEFESDPSNIKLKKWFKSYGELYFSKAKVHAGNKMLSKDKMSARCFLEAYPDMKLIGPKIKGRLKTKKDLLYLMGDKDFLLGFSQQSNYEIKYNLRVEMIRSAGHFLHFENPRSTWKTIEKFIEGDFYESNT